MKTAFVDVVLMVRYGVDSQKKSEKVSRGGLTKDLARDEQQHRPELDLAGLDEKPWCMCVCVTAHTGARYNRLNSMREWSPVGI